MLVSPVGDRCSDTQVPQEHPNRFTAGSLWRPQGLSTVRCLGSRPPSDTNTSLAAQTVKDLPATQETQVGSLGREDPLEQVLAPHSSILAWRIPWTEELGGLQSLGSQTRTRPRACTHALKSMAVGPGPRLGPCLLSLSGGQETF